MKSNEVAFGRPHPKDQSVFVAQVGPDCFLQFRPETGDAAITSKRKKPLKAKWRLNDAPKGKEPSAWLDFPDGQSYALWYEGDRNFYSVKLADNPAAAVKLCV